MIRAIGVLRLALDFSTDFRMQNRLEIRSGVWVRENEISHCGPIKSAGLVEHITAKPPSYLFQCGLARLNEIASYDVGIDDGHVEFAEHIGDG